MHNQTLITTRMPHAQRLCHVLRVQHFGLVLSCPRLSSCFNITLTPALDVVVGVFTAWVLLQWRRVQGGLLDKSMAGVPGRRGGPTSGHDSDSNVSHHRDVYGDIRGTHVRSG